MITLNNSNINFDSEDTSDESKYTISLSNKSSNLIFKTSAIERLKIMNDGNIGIGSFDTITPPLSKLHIRDDNAKLIIQDSREVIYSDIVNFDNNNPIPEPQSIGTDKYVNFIYKGDDENENNDGTSSGRSKYNFKTTTDLKIDILIVGGGGAGGDAYGGGGGGGGVVYIKNFLLLAGNYVVYVGNGGVGLPSSLNNLNGSRGIRQYGAPSSLFKLNDNNTETVITFNINGVEKDLIGSGGGAGGTYLTGQKNGGSGGNTGSGGGSSGGSATNQVAAAPPYNIGEGYKYGGKQGRQNIASVPNLILGGGGGGFGSVSDDQTNGNDGIDINILDTSQIYAAGGGAGIHAESMASYLSTYRGLGGSSSTGGNGRIYNGQIYSRSATSGKDGTGSGGGGSAYQIDNLGIENAGSGGTGVVIIRYRPIISTSSSIELLRNSITDDNTDYKIGNYDGGFKIISSDSGTPAERLVINKNGDIIVGSINARTYLKNGSLFSIEAQSANSSNYVSSTSNILINYINNKKASQWDDNLNSINYPGGNVGIGTNNPIDKLHIYNKISAKTNLTIQNDNYSHILDLPLKLIIQEFNSLYTNEFIYDPPYTITNPKPSYTGYRAYDFKIAVDFVSNSRKTHIITTREQYIVDLLVVGGGGGAGTETGNGAGGAGGIVYIVGKKLDAGTYLITVGNGGAAGANGEPSSIKKYTNGIEGDIITIDGINVLAKGGGRGRTIAIGGTDDTLEIVGNVGSGGGAYWENQINDDRRKGLKQRQGDTFWNISESRYTAGGVDGKASDVLNNRGGDGGGFGTLENPGIPINIPELGVPDYGIGGVVKNELYADSDHDSDGTNNTGEGGSRYRDNFGMGKGGSGYVFIRYRKIPSAIASINLSIGNEKDLSYNISNSNNIFKINSGTSDMMVINSDGNAKFNGNLTAKSYIIEGGINIFKDTCNYITITSNLITNYINNKKSSQWNDNTNLIDIYYNIGKVAIGTNVISDKSSTLTINNIITTGNFDHSIAPLTITNQSVPTIIDPVEVLHLCRVAGANTYNTDMRASFKLGKSEASTGNSRTRLDIELADVAYSSSINVMTILSTGKVGIGKTNPETALDVNGNITATTISATSFSGSINVSGTVSGVLPVSKGGTGNTSLTSGGILFANTATSVSTNLALYWDNTNNNLGIGTNSFNQNSSKLNINENNIYNNDLFIYKTAPLTITNKTPPIQQTFINDPTDVLHLCRVGKNLSAVGTRVSFQLSKWTDATNDSKSKTRFDIALADNTYNTNNIVMTILSTGIVGFGIIQTADFLGLSELSSKLNINNNIDTTFNYSEAPLTITNKTPIPTVGNVNETSDVLHLCRVGVSSTDVASLGVRATFKLSRWNNSDILKSRTRFDIALADNAYNTSNIVMAIRSDGRVAIGTNVISNKSSILTINNFITDGTASAFDHSEAPLTITNQIVPTVTSTVVSSPVDVLHLCRVAGTDTTLNTGMRASFKLGKSEASTGNSKTRLDIALADGEYNVSSINVMTILSTGRVGIGTTNPTKALDVNGDITTTGAISAGSFSTTGAISAGTFTGELSISSITGILPVGKGGTGKASLTNGLLLFANDTNPQTVDQNDKLFWDNTNFKLGIGNSTMTLGNKSSILTINNFITDGTASAFDHSEAPLTITNQIVPTVTSTVVSSPVDVLHLCRVADANVNTLNTGMRASFKLGKSEASTGNSRTRLDIALADNAYNTSNIVMAILSIGRVGIGKTNPTKALDVNGDIIATGAISAGSFSTTGTISAGTLSGTLPIGSLSGTLPVGKGGTGKASLTNGLLLFANNATPQTVDQNEKLFWDNTNFKLGIGNSTMTLGDKSSTLTINNFITDGTASAFDHSSAPLTITNRIAPTVSSTVVSPPVDVLHLCRVAGTDTTLNTGMRASFKLGKSEASTGNSRTRLDIALADVAYNTSINVNVMTILSIGRVGIGTTSPVVALHVRGKEGSSGEDALGHIVCTGDITAYYSDERLKTKISTINNPLSIVNKLNGFYYKSNELATKYGMNNKKIEIGLSAQDVQNVLPELVKLAPFDMKMNEDGDIISKSGEKYLTISYERIVPVLVEAIKELEVKNNCLNEKYENILQEISLIKNKINLNME